MVEYFMLGVRLEFCTLTLSPASFRFLFRQALQWKVCQIQSIHLLGKHSSQCVHCVLLKKTNIFLHCN